MQFICDLTGSALKIIPLIDKKKSYCQQFFPIFEKLRRVFLDFLNFCNFFVILPNSVVLQIGGGGRGGEEVVEWVVDYQRYPILNGIKQRKNSKSFFQKRSF